MKLNHPRFTLIAGLALALSLNVSIPAHGAGATKKAQPDLRPMPMPNAPSDLPALSPTPMPPNQMGPTPLQPDPRLKPQPLSPNAPSVMSVPTTLGSQPALSPIDRPPMGLYFGEKERLDSLNGVAPRPLPTSQYPSSVSPPQPPGVNGIPLDPMPGPIGTPGLLEGSGLGGLQPDQGPHDRFGYAPPPGTLGQTYKRRSRVLEETKHPRVGVVEVHLPETMDVTATGLKSKWTGKVWRLESDPLLPGIPHIYEIKASMGEGTDSQVRTVRLIMGRIVDLDF